MPSPVPAATGLTTLASDAAAAVLSPMLSSALVELTDPSGLAPATITADDAGGVATGTTGDWGAEASLRCIKAGADCTFAGDVVSRAGRTTGVTACMATGETAGNTPALGAMEAPGTASDGNPSGEGTCKPCSGNADGTGAVKDGVVAPKEMLPRLTPEASLCKGCVPGSGARG